MTRNKVKQPEKEKLSEKKKSGNVHVVLTHVIMVCFFTFFGGVCVARTVYSEEGEPSLQIFCSSSLHFLLPIQSGWWWRCSLKCVFGKLVLIKENKMACYSAQWFSVDFVNTSVILLKIDCYGACLKLYGSLWRLLKSENEKCILIKRKMKSYGCISKQAEKWCTFSFEIYFMLL